MNWEEAVVWLRNQKGREDLVKACFYDDPLIGAAKRYWKSTEWVAVRKYLPKEPGKVLDLGAGRGISSFAFAKEGWEVAAVEPDPSPIVGARAIKKLARDAHLNIKVSGEWGEELPFKDGFFDVVFARQALHHAKDLGKLCKEVGRVLKKGGIFIAIREHVISAKKDLPIFLSNHPLHKLYGGENAFLLNEYLKAIENANIRLTAVLNPIESDINLFPRSDKYLPKIIAKFLGNLIRYPGRIYSFVGIKI